MRPDVFDIDLYVDGHRGKRPHHRHGGRGRHSRPGRARGVLRVGGRCRALPARLPQVRQVRPATSPQPDRQAVQPPVPERVLAQPQERARTARLHLAPRRSPDAKMRPGRVRRDRVRRRGRLLPGAQGHRLADHGSPSAHLQPCAGANRAPVRALGGAQERPRAGPEAGAAFDYAINEQCFQYAECTNSPRPGTGPSPAPERRCSRSSTAFRAAASAAAPPSSDSSRSRRRATSPCGQGPGSPAASGPRGSAESACRGS